MAAILTLAGLTALAATMVGATIYLLCRLYPRTGPAPDLGTVVLALGAFVMSIGLWGALVYAVVVPGDSSYVAVFLAINSMMAVVGAWLIAVFLRAEERRLSAGGWVAPVSFAVLVLLNELFMASAFVLIVGGSAPYFGPGGPGIPRLIGDAATSPWFFGSMMVNMLAVILWVPFSAAERRALVGLSASSLVGPWVLGSPVVGGAVMAGLMGGVLLVSLRDIGRAAGPRFGRVAAGMALGYGVMAIGAFASLTLRDPQIEWVPFASAVFLVMAGELVYVGRFALSHLGEEASAVPEGSSPMELSVTGTP